MMIRAEINEIEFALEKSKKAKMVFEKNNKIDKPLDGLTKRKEKTQSINIRN